MLRHHFCCFIYSHILLFTKYLTCFFSCVCRYVKSKQNLLCTNIIQWLPIHVSVPTQLNVLLQLSFVLWIWTHQTKLFKLNYDEITLIGTCLFWVSLNFKTKNLILIYNVQKNLHTFILLKHSWYESWYVYL